MGCSNNLTGIVNFITTLLSIPIIAVGIWLAHKHNTDCVRFLQWPVIILGVFILVVSLAGFVGSCWRISWLLWVYLFVMFLLIFLLFVFTIFAFVVTNKGAGQAVSGKGYKEYKLGDYSNWLQNRVNNPTNWNDIKSCLSDGKFCNGLDAAYPTQAAFNSASLTPIESGCCKPPSDCGYTFQNATTWVITPSATVDVDCRTWSNDQTLLCYSCNSCKAGVLQNLKMDWRKVAIVNISMLVLLIVFYSVGCCAFRNIRKEGNGGGYGKYGYA